ncbi:hypothetical protein [Thermohalobacter berrensis]|uniref:hypothetical protein n=1 Tax=Thermohalobacter berrensis TaxID=99594 RepID=UPI0015FF1CCC|nr:hypothetical protein [Thermohalobacter berrensis]
MNYEIILIFIFFTIFISIQYSLNRILSELREIKKILIQLRIKDWEDKQHEKY